MARLLLLAFVLLIAGPHAGDISTAADAAPVCRCQQCRDCPCALRGGWYVVETPNFSVWTRDSQHQAVETAQSCEELRTSLQSDWSLTDNNSAWQPKCAVVVHAGIDDYRRELGGQDQSVGCTTVTCDEGRIVFRRIDLRADAIDWQSNALPHELSHVILADRFGDRPLPYWLNEGLAMLAENESLRLRRSEVLSAAQARGDVPTLKHVLASNAGLTHHDADVSYAVSASVVRLLEQDLGRDGLLEFAERWTAAETGAAATEHFAVLGGLDKWERRWLDSLRRIEPAPLTRNADRQHDRLTLLSADASTIAN